MGAKKARLENWGSMIFAVLIIILNQRTNPFDTNTPTKIHTDFAKIVD